ncbi:MAG TPA: TolC family protein [Luteibaculaceae bacterium]|nr:TolC family protein [Luteibaculaceae bacterium]
MKKWIFSLAVLISPLLGWAQLVLTLDEAIKMALEKNVNVEISALARDMRSLAARNNVSDLLPTAQGDLGLNRSKNDVSQQLSDNRIIARNGAVSTVQNASVTLSYTLFNGFKAYSIIRQSSLQENYADVVYKQQLADVIEQTILVYSQLHAARRGVEAREEVLRIYSDRLDIVEQKLASGLGDKTAVLQSKIDVNRIRGELIALKESIRPLQEQLALLMGWPEWRDFATADYTLDRQAGNQSSAANNLLVQAEQINRSIVREQIAIAKADFLPRLSLNAGGAYALSQNQAGFLLRNQNQGISYGFTLSVPLFGGFKASRSIRMARMAAESAQLTFEQQQRTIATELSVARTEWMVKLQLLSLEEENLTLAKENAALLYEKFKQNLISLLELRTAQELYAQSQLRQIQLFAESKTAESKVLNLCGLLVK